MLPAKGASIDLQGSLEEAILHCKDLSELSGLLHKQAMVAAPSAKLDVHLRTFIDNPVPHLTALVFRVYRHTGSKDAVLHKAAASYLSLRCYNGDWYDETINSIGWANELIAASLTSPLTLAYTDFIVEAERAGDQGLLDFCNGYAR